jgi:hypothetical protein
MEWLLAVGVVLEVDGLLLALYALHTRQADFGVPGQGAFYPATAALQRFRDRIRQQVVRRLRPPKDARVEPGTAGLEAHAFNPTVRIGYGPLPDDRDAAIVELDRRTKELLDRIQDVRDRFDSETERIDKHIEAVRSEIGSQARRLEDQIRELATGDVALQYVGLSLVAIGLTLQFVASVLG